VQRADVKTLDLVINTSHVQLESVNNQNVIDFINDAHFYDKL